MKTVWLENREQSKDQEEVRSEGWQVRSGGGVCRALNVILQTLDFILSDTESCEGF